MKLQRFMKFVWLHAKYIGALSVYTSRLNCYPVTYTAPSYVLTATHAAFKNLRVYKCSLLTNHNRAIIDKPINKTESLGCCARASLRGSLN